MAEVVRWEASDRRTEGTWSDITRRISIEDFPYEIRIMGGIWALGSTGALVAYNSQNPNEAESRAYLMAAAPDLLAACEAVVRMGSHSHPPASEKWQAAMMCKDAIQRAKGYRP